MYTAPQELIPTAQFPLMTTECEMFIVPLNVKAVYKQNMNVSITLNIVLYC